MKPDFGIKILLRSLNAMHGMPWNADSSMHRDIVVVTLLVSSLLKSLYIFVVLEYYSFIYNVVSIYSTFFTGLPASVTRGHVILCDRNGGHFPIFDASFWSLL